MHTSILLNIIFDIEIFMAHIVRYRRIELLLKEKNKLILYSGPNSKNMQFDAVAYIYMTKTSDESLIACNANQRDLYNRRLLTKMHIWPKLSLYISQKNV